MTVAGRHDAAETGVTIADAARRLADWGFLARPDLPNRDGPASLLVALREEPTLRHYDPEAVTYWATEHDRGRRRSITRDTTMPIETEFSWGPIQIVDRLRVTNEYLSFGGSLRADRIGDAVIVAFTSPVPLLRRGGHSQGWDPGADRLGAHFGRFLAAVDCVPGFEEEAARADPVTRYAMFLVDATTQYGAAATLPRPQAELRALLEREVRRIQDDDRDAWLRGVALWQRSRHLDAGPFVAPLAVPLRAGSSAIPPGSSTRARRRPRRRPTPGDGNVPSDGKA